MRFLLIFFLFLIFYTFLIFLMFFIILVNSLYLGLECCARHEIQIFCVQILLLLTIFKGFPERYRALFSQFSESGRYVVTKKTHFFACFLQLKKRDGQQIVNILCLLVFVNTNYFSILPFLNKQQAEDMHIPYVKP